LIPTHPRRLTEFDDKILALYARGLTVRDIRAFLHEMYAVEVSPDLISTVTDAVQHEAAAWQARPLEPMYPGDEGVVQSKAVYLAHPRTTWQTCVVHLIRRSLEGADSVRSGAPDDLHHERAGKREPPDPEGDGNARSLSQR
jgi:transposase-like protein